MQTNSATLRSGDMNRLPTYLAAALLSALLVWTYADAVQGLWTRWSTDPAYGHGFFVPLFALYLLWHRRKYFQPPFTGSWWGVLGIFVAFAFELTGEYWYFALLEPFSIVPMVAGLCLLLLGWRGLRWYGPSTMFLVFMVPLPGRIADLMSQPLQRIATIASTYLVQLVGIPAVAEGNVIVLTHAKIGVIEACNGLRMLTQFIAVATAVAILIDRPFWCRCVILASAVPVALAANILRITTAALAHEYASAEFATSYFHGLAGWLMMPLGILMLYLELVFIDRAFPERE
ncbi:MAG: exosortase/archaeosortase family protein, partial [Pirellulales bacterium]